MNRDCKDCKHVRKSTRDEFIFNWGVRFYCTRPAVWNHDVVTGEDWCEDETDCRDERYKRGIIFNRHRCGIEGKYWEPKE